MVPCLHCGVATQVLIFPALFRPPPLPDAGVDALPAEATCFYHPSKKAVIPCDACGRFLCALCDVEWHSRHYCMSCLEKVHKGEDPHAPQARRMLYDNLAISVAILPLFFLIPFFFITLLTAPAALYLSIKALRQPRGIVPGRRLRAMIALAFSIVQIVAWFVFAVISINRLLT
jgi:hypothetical protein